MRNVIVDLSALLILAREERKDSEASVLKDLYRGDVLKLLHSAEKVAVFTERYTRLIEPTLHMLKAEGVRVDHAEFGATLDRAGTASTLRAALNGMAITDATVITTRRVVTVLAAVMGFSVLPLAWLEHDEGFRLIERGGEHFASPSAK